MDSYIAGSNFRSAISLLCGFGKSSSFDSQPSLILVMGIPDNSQLRDGGHNSLCCIEELGWGAALMGTWWKLSHEIGRGENSRDLTLLVVAPDC